MRITAANRQGWLLCANAQHSASHRHSPIINNYPNGNADAERTMRTIKEELFWLCEWSSLEHPNNALYGRKMPHYVHQQTGKKLEGFSLKGRLVCGGITMVAQCSCHKAHATLLKAPFSTLQAKPLTDFRRCNGDCFVT